MIKLYTALLLTLFVIGSASCKKDKRIEGCTDPNSTNYNPDANVNDGSCAYEVDQFCGTWTLTDTILDQTTLQDTVITHGISITRTGWNTVDIAVLGGSSCMATIKATGDNNVLTISAQDNDEFFCSNSATVSGTATLTGNTLDFSYVWNWFMPNLHDLTCNGRAVR
ncbi:MAG: hypothetical protein L6Q81_16200 [Bacteroidia bacterium]|nr:hypothetical protein [Bacteroidia bacterium]